MDILKLTKLMMLTSSPNDNEALVALRKANNILNESNINWEQFISKKKIVVNEIVQITKIQKEPDIEIEKMLVFCLSYVISPSGKEFIQGLQKWYDEKGFLTEHQRIALKKWYDNL